VELFITIDGERYWKRLIELLPRIKKHIDRVGWTVARALPQIKDETFVKAVKEAFEKYKMRMDKELAGNSYHVPFRPAIWGVAWSILRFAMEQYYLLKAFPEMFSPEPIFAVVNYVLGCHPGSNVSLVSGVGARSLTGPIFSAQWLLEQRLSALSFLSSRTIFRSFGNRLKTS